MEGQKNDEDNSLYFNFFLSELPKCFPYIRLFPWASATLFSTCNHHLALRECVLSIAILLKDGETETSHTKSFGHLQRAMELLRNTISSFDVDEHVVTGSFLLAYCNLLHNDFRSTRIHLQGMLSVFESLDPGNMIRDSFIPSPEHVTPLMILIWRIAIWMDIVSSIASGGDPILPRFMGLYSICANISLSNEEDGIQKAWVQAFAGRHNSPHNVEWAEAWFRIDSLMHKGCHLAVSVKRSRQYSEGESESQVSNLIKSIIKEHHGWLEKNIVSKALEIERASELSSKQHPFEATKQIPNSFPIFPSSLSVILNQRKPIPFLDHEPTHINDCFFACRLNRWRAVNLYLALIQERQWLGTNGEAFVEAVALCSSHAAHRGECSPFGSDPAIDLYIAGLIFGGPDMYSVAFSSS
jgi:hypothetical protein